MNKNIATDNFMRTVS